MTTELESLRSEVAQLKQLNAALSWNEQLGCWTRPAFEHMIWNSVSNRASWVIFFDVDHMKDLNTRAGWDNTSQIVRESISLRSDDYVIGQCLSGDEFIVVVTERPNTPLCDPRKLCERLQANLKQRGASATFAYGRVTSTDLETNMKPVKHLVWQAKNDERRGSINAVE